MENKFLKCFLFFQEPSTNDKYYDAMFAAKIQVEEDLRELLEHFEFIRLEKKYEEEEVRMRKKKVTFRQCCDENDEEDIWDMKEFIELEKWFEEEDKKEKMTKKTFSKKIRFRRKVVDDDKGGRRRGELGRKDAVKEMYRGMKDLIEKLK